MQEKIKVGDRFHFITVTSEPFMHKHGPRKIRHMSVKCLCDCGTEFIAICSVLRLGRKSCTKFCTFKQKKLFNETVVRPERMLVNVGEKYGNWTVIQEPYFKTLQGKSQMERQQYAKCRCSCGKESDVYCYNLIYGKSKSCGCLLIEMMYTLNRKGTLAKDGFKSCSKCLKNLPVSDFEKNTNKNRDGYYPQCRRCRKGWQMLKTYGLTIEQYEALEEKQNGRCAICNTDDAAPHFEYKGKHTLFIDHDHETGKIRGLLCLKCNTSLGGFKDSTELLEKAISYLKEHNNENSDGKP